MQKIGIVAIFLFLSGCYVASGYDDLYYDDMQTTYVMPSAGTTYVEQGYATTQTTYITPAATQSTFIYERTQPVVYINQQPDIIYYNPPAPKPHSPYFYPRHAPQHKPPHKEPPHEKHYKKPPQEHGNSHQHGGSHHQPNNGHKQPGGHKHK